MTFLQLIETGYWSRQWWVTFNMRSMQLKHRIWLSASVLLIPTMCNKITVYGKSPCSESLNITHTWRCGWMNFECRINIQRLFSVHVAIPLNLLQRSGGWKSLSLKDQGVTLHKTYLTTCAIGCDMFFWFTLNLWSRADARLKTRGPGALTLCLNWRPSTQECFEKF